MPRIRTIKPEFFTDEVVAALDPLDRIAFIGLWLYADKGGKLEWRPRQLGVSILPYEKGDFENRLDRLVQAGLIVKYSVNGHTFAKVRNFLKHQKPHLTERESVIPEPEEITVIKPSDNGYQTVISTLNNVLITTGKERKGKEHVNGDPRVAERLFAVFWESYPKKRAKEYAHRVFLKLPRKAQEEAARVAKAYREIRMALPEDEAVKFTPEPSTWLNKGRWEDLDVQRKADEMGLAPIPVDGELPLEAP